MQYTDLQIEQLKLEQEMRDTGAQKFLASQKKMVDKNLGSSAAAGATLINQYATSFYKLIKEDAQKKLSGKAGVKARAVTKLKQVANAKGTIKYRTIAIAALSTYIDYAMSSDGSNKKEFICNRIGTAIEDEARYEYMTQNHGDWISFKMKEYKETGRSYFNQRSGVVHASNNYRTGFVNWTRNERIDVGFYLLEMLRANYDLIIEHKKMVNKRTHIYFELSDKAKKIIDYFNENVSEMCNDYRPCVVKPQEWTAQTHGGYHTIELPFLKENQYADIDSVDFNRHMATVNVVQSTPWAIDTEMLDVMKALFNSDADLVASSGKTLINSSTEVPPPVRDDILNDETARDTQEFKDALSKYKSEAAGTIVLNNRRRSKRKSMYDALSIANRYDRYEKIYFPHQVDFRGRAYPVPTILNPQSADSIRCMLKFANKKKLDNNGLRWLAIHVAGLWGYDKVSLDDRVQYVYDNIEQVKMIGLNPLDNRGLWIDADKPFQFIQGCREFANAHAAMIKGEDFYTDIPVQVDGKCNGLQHYTLMSRDEVVAPYVGLTNTEVPGDIYLRVADGMLALLSDIDSSDADYELAQAWIEYGVSRALAKRPTMTCVYGSDTYGYAEQIRSEIEKLDKSHHPEGNLFKLCNFLAKIVTKALKAEIEGSMKAMDFLKKITAEYTKFYNSREESPGLTFHTPTGLMVTQKYRKKTDRKEKVRLGNKQAEIRIDSFVEGMESRKMTNSICPNFVHSIDASHMMLTIERCYNERLDDFSMIHDSYGVHASDVELLLSHIKESAIEIYSHDLLARFKDEISAKLPKKIADRLPAVPPKGTFDLNELRDADFFFS